MFAQEPEPPVLSRPWGKGLTKYTVRLSNWTVGLGCVTETLPEIKGLRVGGGVQQGEGRLMKREKVKAPLSY